MDAKKSEFGLGRGLGRGLAIVLVFVLGGCADSPIWHDGDQRVSVTTGSFFEGGYAFERDADQLTDEQVELLRAVETINASDGCTSDVASATITVTDAAGRKHSYRANADGEGCDSDEPFVDYAALKAFLDTASCLRSKADYAATRGEAHVVGVGDGCRHGLFNPGSQLPEWWIRIDVDEPATVRIATEECRDRELRLSVFDPDGKRKLASEQAPGTPCVALEHEFGAAGSYPIRLEMLGGEAAGDFLLEITPVAGGD